MFVRLVRWLKSLGSSPPTPIDEDQNLSSATSQENENSIEQESNTSPCQPKFSKPKILLVDLPKSCGEQLRQRGFNTTEGTLGCIYKVPQSTDYAPINSSMDLPNLAEQEVVIVNLSLTEPVALLKSKNSVETTRKPYMSRQTGIIDSRLISMWAQAQYFNRILAHGGIFIIFAEPRNIESVLFSGGRVEDRLEKIDNWSFLTMTKELNFATDHGYEMTVTDGQDPLRKLLRQFTDGSQITTSIKADYPLSRDWDKLILNKFGVSVGGMVSFQPPGGVVIILPQIKDKERFITELIQNVLPSMAPQLFPHFVAQRWVTDQTYELQEVLECKKRIAALENELATKVSMINQEIDQHRETSGYLHKLLSEQSDNLAAAAKVALENLGFNQVINVDNELGTGNKQEDLQIRDGSPLIIVEVKGINGMPTEDDTTQVVKYMNRRMRDLDRTDIRGLVIINHQRQLPPLERNNDKAFTDAQILDAENQAYTLLTTWDLFRLIRGMIQWEWPPEALRTLLQAPGRVPATPAHYTPIGVVEKRAPQQQVIGIKIEAGELKVGDRIGFVTPTGFIEQPIESMHFNKQPIQTGTQGQLVGVETTFDIRESTIVYRVTNSPAA